MEEGVLLWACSTSGDSVKGSSVGLHYIRGQWKREFCGPVLHQGTVKEGVLWTCSTSGDSVKGSFVGLFYISGQCEREFCGPVLHLGTV